MESTQKITRDTFFNIIHIFLKIVTGLILSVLITRFLDPKDFGCYTLLLSIMTTAALVINLGFPNTVVKYVSEYRGRKDSHSINGIIGYCLSLELKFGLFIISLLVLLIPLWKRVFPLNINEILVCSAGVLPLAFITIMSSIARGLRKFDLLGLVSFITLLSSLSFSSVVLLIGLKVKTLLVCVIFSNLIGLFMFYIFLRKDVGFRLMGNVDGEIKKKVGEYNKYLTAIVFIDFVILQNAEVLFLATFRTTQEVAYYSLAFTLANGIMIIPQAYTTVLFPVFSGIFGRGQEGLDSLYVLAMKRVTVVVLPILVVAFFFAKPIFSVMYPASYIESSLLFQILIVSSSISAVCGVGSSALYAAERQAAIFKLVIAMGAVNIVLDLALIPNFGAKGASIAHLLSQASASIITMIIFYRFSKISLLVNFFAKACVAALPMVLFFFTISKNFSSLYLCIISGFIGLFSYLVGLSLMKIISWKRIVNILVRSLYI